MALLGGMDVFEDIVPVGDNRTGIAEASGVPNVHRTDTVPDFAAAFDRALKSTELTTIVAKVAAVGPTSFAMDLLLLENRFQFKRHLERLRTAGT